MFLVKDSLTIVILGDWNKLYIQPDWIAANVYFAPEIEIGISGQGVEYRISYKYNDIIIAPSQDKMVFTALNIKDETIELLVKCVNNFLEEAFSPSSIVYGFNCDYEEFEDSFFAHIVDDMQDNDAIIRCGYIIKETRISRKLVNDGVILNLESCLEEDVLKMHFNEHYDKSPEESVEITTDRIKQFLQTTRTIITEFGYDLEEML